MRIAFVVHDYHQSGGHSRYVTELATRFGREHEVHVFANTINLGSSNGIQFHRVPAWRRSALTTILTFVGPASRKLNGSFDIIHAQGLSCFGANVLTAHICNRAWFLARERQERRIALKERVFDRLVSPLEKMLYQSTSKPWIITASERVRKDIADCYGRRDRTKVIYHGVDIELFHPRNCALYRGPVREALWLNDSDFAFLFVGDLRKGAEITLESLARVPNAKLVLMSRTPLQKYQRRAEEMGVADRVRCCGPTDSIQEYYGAADAFVFPTPYDAFGMVISEAMATGLPVITTREAGAAELIQDQQNGLLMSNPFDGRQLAQLMTKLMSDAALRRSLGNAARERMESQTWDRVAEQTMGVYQRVLAERSR
jgi:UDP-glucose:(heptosyl)LPS alpha-1,3-glucosyltransferase